MSHFWVRGRARLRALALVLAHAARAPREPAAAGDGRRGGGEAQHGHREHEAQGEDLIAGLERGPKLGRHDRFDKDVVVTL